MFTTILVRASWRRHTLNFRGATALRSGELTLSGTFNAFELDTEERKLVYEIIDLMKQHEEKNKKSET